MKVNKAKTVKVSREWLCETVPTALEMVARGQEQPAWYAETFGLTHQSALKKIIQAIRDQANE